MKILLFCNEINSAQIVFELIKLRVFSGIVVPPENIELIKKISDSGYVQDNQLFTPDPKNDNEILEVINSVQPNVGLIATFPRIFPKKIYNVPPLGFYNIHYGTIPKYRSANPVFWQIKNGEKYGGITIMKVDNSIDGGPVLLKEKFPIDPFDNYTMVLHKSVIMACQLVAPLIDKLSAGNLELEPQDQIVKTYFPKPELKDVSIDWQNMSMAEITATINAGNPWNKGAITSFEGQELRIIQASPAKYDKELPEEPGKVFFADAQHGTFVLCKNRELLRIDTIYSHLGYSTGAMLLCAGLKEGIFFN